MDHELKRRIAEDLRKAGFESEMLAIEEFARRPLWQCDGSVGYRDKDQDVKLPSAASSSYGALVSVCKAAESALDAEEASRAPLKNALKDSILFTLVKPVVVVDGPLVSAMLGVDASIDIAEISSAVLRFQFRTARYTRENYHVDLVTLPYLPRYLEMCEHRVTFFRDALAEASGSAQGGIT